MAEKEKEIDVGKDFLEIIEKSVSAGVRSGIAEGIREIEKNREDKKQKQFDTRKFNTQLLLQNYRNMKTHISNSVYSSEQIKLLERERKEFKIDFDEPMDDTYIKSIIKSKITTRILIEQVDVFLNYYKTKCQNSPKEEERRRWEVINLLYVAEKDEFGNKIEKSVPFEEIADILHTTTRTVNRDKKAAIRELSVLFFGIEGLKIKNF